MGKTTEEKNMETKETKKPKEPKPERAEVKIEPKIMKVKIIFTAPLLGTSPNNPDIYADFIGSKSADAEKIEEELAGLSADALAAKGKTVFHRTDNDVPMLYDYQIKGMIKEAFVIFDRLGELKCGSLKIYKSLVKSVVDKYIFVYPREIPLALPDGGEIDECVRPLRADTMQGPRVSLACSERAPKGTVLECTIEWLHPGLEKHIIAALEYGKRSGLGQWRNSGMGRFDFEILE